MMKYLWFFDIDAILAIPFIMACLFALGGSGLKWIRRIGAPAFVFASAWSVGVDLWVSLISACLLALTLIKGYGEDLKGALGDYYYSALFMVGFAYGASMMPMASSPMHLLYCFVPSFVFGGLTFTSQKFDFPTWKLVELFTGFAIGVVLLILLS